MKKGGSREYHQHADKITYLKIAGSSAEAARGCDRALAANEAMGLNPQCQPFLLETTA